MTSPSDEHLKNRPRFMSDAVHSFCNRYSSNYSIEPSSLSPAASSNASSNKFNRNFHWKEKKRLENEWNEGKNDRKLYNKHGRDPQTVIYTHTSRPNQRTGGERGYPKKLGPINFNWPRKPRATSRKSRKLLQNLRIVRRCQRSAPERRSS